MSEIAKLNSILLAGFISLLAVAFWPLNPYTNAEKLPELLPMVIAEHPLEGYEGVLFNTDWNGDGADDVVTLSGKHVGVYSLNKVDIELTQIARVESDETAQALAGVSFDVDADGDLDLVVAHSYGLALYENRKQRIWPKLITEWDVKKAWLALSDVDQDGQLEIIVSAVSTSQNGTDKRTALYNLKGEALQRIAAAAGPVAWSDFDNDGHLELVIAEADQPVSIYQQAQDTWQATTLATGSAAWSALSIADYDADGDQDLLVSSAGYSPKWRLINNQSEKGELSLKVVDPGVLGRLRYSRDALWQDINADGLLDVMAAQSQPAWAVVGCCGGVAMLQRPRFGEAESGADSISSKLEFINADNWAAVLSNSSSLASGDYNGDGLADVAAYSAAGGLSVAINQRDQNYVAIRLPQTADSLGARVMVETTAGKTYTQKMHGYGDLHFGFGPHWKSKNLVVRWSNGAITIIEQPHINQRLHISP